MTGITGVKLTKFSLYAVGFIL